MADSTSNVPPVSRRMWLAGLGGGLLAAPVLRWIAVPRPSSRTGSRAATTGCCPYVDRDGWMLTPEDAAALDSRPSTR